MGGDLVQRQYAHHFAVISGVYFDEYKLVCRTAAA